MSSPLYRFKIILLGESAVGKTSLIKKYAKIAVDSSYKMTIGTDIYTKKVLINNTHAIIIVWDLAGQQTFAKVRPMFYNGAHGALLIFDITREITLTKLDTWLSDLKKHAGDIPILLVGNKVDLNDKREVPYSKAKEYADSLGCEYFETSALTGKNVNEVFDSLVKKILQLQK